MRTIFDSMQFSPSFSQQYVEIGTWNGRAHSVGCLLNSTAPARKLYAVILVTACVITLAAGEWTPRMMPINGTLWMKVVPCYRRRQYVMLVL